MIVSNYLTTKSILLAPEVTDKGDLIRMLVSCLEGVGTQFKNIVANAVLEREEVMSTGVGNGIAIPHAKVEVLEEPMVAFALLQAPVDFGSFDGKPVDLVFLVAGSNKSNSHHLKILSALSRILINQHLVDGLRNSRSPVDVLAKIQQAETHAVQI
jgi:fructose-specific phosphotransferase system IIA component